MSKEQIVPVSDYLLVGVESNENKENTLILNLSVPIENRGIVKAVGDKVNIDEGSIKVQEGDKILYTPGAGIKVTNSEDSDILLSIKNVIGLIREE